LEAVHSLTDLKVLYATTNKPTYDMKKLILLLFIPLVFACETISTEELAEEVKVSMMETFKETSGLEDTEIIEFGLVHKGGNEYQGLLKVKEPNVFGELIDAFTDNDNFEDTIEKNYQVEVIYDGENIQWRIIE